MTGIERVVRWNRWYDGLPSEWRFQFILWPLILIGAINFMLTASAGFPFGLLVLLAIIGVAAVRVPFTLGYYTLTDADGAPGVPGIQLPPVRWIIALNQRYEALAEPQRIGAIATVLIVVGAMNMMLTIGAGFPFGLLFLLAILAVVAVRAPFANGWYKQPVVTAEAIGITPAIEAEPAADVIPVAINQDVEAPLAVTPVHDSIVAVEQPVAPSPILEPSDPEQPAAQALADLQPASKPRASAAPPRRAAKRAAVPQPAPAPPVIH
jgi:hypothetical protein